MTQLQFVKYLLHNLARLGYILSPANIMTNHERFEQCKCILATLLNDALDWKQLIESESNALALAQDGIRIALKIAGVKNVDSMTQFERASALLNMAQEHAALTDKQHTDEKPFDVVFNTRKSAAIWERLSVRSWEITLGE